MPKKTKKRLQEALRRRRRRRKRQFQTGGITTLSNRCWHRALPRQVPQGHRLLVRDRDGFDRKPLADWTVPAQGEWDRLNKYLAEREKVEEATRRLVALFKEAFAIPDVQFSEAKCSTLTNCYYEYSFVPSKETNFAETAWATHMQHRALILWARGPGSRSGRIGGVGRVGGVVTEPLPPVTVGMRIAAHPPRRSGRGR